jgi:hypothetical protein
MKSHLVYLKVKVCSECFYIWYDTNNELKRKLIYFRSTFVKNHLGSLSFKNFIQNINEVSQTNNESLTNSHSRHESKKEFVESNVDCHKQLSIHLKTRGWNS